MTGLVGFVVAGALAVLGLTLLGVHFLAPVRVDPVKALAALSPLRHLVRTRPVPVAPSDSIERVGNWAMRTLPDDLWLRTPITDLSLLHRSLTRFYGEKLIFTLYGLIIAPLIVWVLGTFGLQLPSVVPVVGALALAVAMFFLPNWNAIDDAKRLRAELRRELALYMDAVALERAGGSGVRQAMEHAADAGEHWIWARIGEELTQSRTSGQQPWDALAALADELVLPELADLANVLRLAGEEGTAARKALEARSTALRSAIVTDDLAAAHANNVRLDLPVSMLGLVFIALLIAPAVLRIFLNT